jgi:uncharacterized membrane protein YhhN
MAIATTEENSSGSAALNTLFGVMAIAAILSSVLGPDWHWLHYVSKPLATALLLVLVWRILLPISTRYKWAILTGLVFALCGDVFLMLPQDHFVAGLICFLITHCFYIIALTSDARFGAKPLTFVACIVVASCMVWGLWASLAPDLKLPVAAYALVLGLMAAQAISRAQFLSTRSARLAAIGAVLFMISDSILAYGKFRFDIPLQGLWVLTTYFAAQWFVAKSVAHT